MTRGGEKQSAPIPLRPVRKCPICERPATREHYPFCSTRCADIDLGRWLSGTYVIPGPAEDAEDEQPETGSKAPTRRKPRPP
jgi:endogenous inhibitor of DNA gyrase (YacG/DUF329 family)